MLELGQQAHDKITGFSGRIIGRTSYITGCDQYAIQPRVNEKGEVPDARWYDEQRIVVDADDPAMALDNARAGADRYAPAPTK